MATERKARMLALTAGALAFALAACGGESDDPPRGGASEDDAVRINQGTNPSIEGLSIGFATVSGDEAGMQIVGHAGDEMTIVEGRPGDRVERATTYSRCSRSATTTRAVM